MRQEIQKIKIKDKYKQIFWTLFAENNPYLIESTTVATVNEINSKVANIVHNIWPYHIEFTISRKRRIHPSTDSNWLQGTRSDEI